MLTFREDASKRVASLQCFFLLSCVCTAAFAEDEGYGAPTLDMMMGGGELPGTTTTCVPCSTMTPSAAVDTANFDDAVPPAGPGPMLPPEQQIAPPPVVSAADHPKAFNGKDALKIILPTAIGGGLAVAGATAGIVVGVTQHMKKEREEREAMTPAPTPSPGFLAQAAIQPQEATQDDDGGGSSSALDVYSWTAVAVVAAFILLLCCSYFFVKSIFCEKKSTRRSAQPVNEQPPVETNKSAEAEAIPLLQPFSTPPSRNPSLASSVYLQGVPTQATPLKIVSTPSSIKTPATPSVVSSVVAPATTSVVITRNAPVVGSSMQAPTSPISTHSSMKSTTSLIVPNTGTAPASPASTVTIPMSTSIRLQAPIAPTTVQPSTVYIRK